MPPTIVFSSDVEYFAVDLFQLPRRRLKEKIRTFQLYK